jgi:uncharacterized protein involved in tolerance to divalent cations
MHNRDDGLILELPHRVNIPMRGECEGRMNDSFFMSRTITGNEKETNRLSAVLVESRLEAYVQAMSIQNSYVWQGKVVREPKTLLQIKTRADLCADMETVIIGNHKHEVPETIQLPIMNGSRLYPNWFREVTR